MAYKIQNADQVIETQLDVSDGYLFVPAHRLEADQYSADDIDGVTESLFGSGNMAYASLQASQTDMTLLNENGMIGFEGDSASDVVSNNGAVNGVNLGDESANTTSFNNNGVDVSPPQTPPAFQRGNAGSNASESGFSGTVGSVGASQLSSDAGAFTPRGSGLSLGDGLGGANGSNGSNGNNGADGDDGGDGNNGDTANCNDGCGDIIINLGDINVDLSDSTQIVQSLVVELGDTINVLGDSIENVTNILGDTINNINLSEIINVSKINFLVKSVSENITQTIDQTLIEITEISNNLMQIVNDLDLSLDVNVLDIVTGDVNAPLDNIFNTGVDLNINVNTVFETIESLSNMIDFGPLSGAVDTLSNATIVLQKTINQITDAVNNLDVNDIDGTISQVTDSLGDLEGAVSGVSDSLDDIVSDVLGGIGGGDGADDEGLVSQTADPVVNDVVNVVDDITNGATEDLTDTVDDIVDTVTDVVDNLTGDITDGLLGENNNNQEGADSDITTDLGVDILDNEIVDEPLEIAIDQIEDVVGDLDLDIGLDTDLLGGGEETDNAAGDTDISVETDIDLVDENIADIVSDIPLDPIEEVTGDIDLNIDGAVDLLGDVADPLVNNSPGGTGEGTVIAGIGNALEDAVDSVLGDNSDAPLGSAMETITESLNETLGIGNSTPEDSDVTIDNNFDIAGHDVADLDLDIVFDPIEDIAGDVDVDSQSGVNLLNNTQTDNDAGDTDLNVGVDIDVLDTDIINEGIAADLDIVENITGDIDLDINAATDIFGETADPLVNDGAGGTSDNSIPSIGDDAVDEIVIDFVDATDIGDADLDNEIASDIIDGITSDIDGGLDDALDLLSAEGSDDGLGTNNDDTTSWTDSTISDATGLFDDLVDGLGGVGDVLPDPSGTVSEGLGVLDVEPEIDVSSLGGLFG